MGTGIISVVPDLRKMPCYQFKWVTIGLMLVLIGPTPETEGQNCSICNVTCGSSDLRRCTGTVPQCQVRQCQVCCYHPECKRMRPNICAFTEWKSLRQFLQEWKETNGQIYL